MSAKIEHEVTVHKAGLSLKPNESVHDFTRQLQDGARVHFTNKFGISKGKGDAYVCEVFSTSVIVEVFKWDDSDPKNRQKYYAATYKRKDDGAFDFETAQEVARVIRYEAVSSAPAIAKSAPSVFRGLLF
jgi:hypothetical protein